MVESRGLGRVFLRDGVINQEQLDKALKRAQLNSQDIIESISDLGYSTKEELLTVLAKRVGSEFIEDPTPLLREEDSRIIPESLAREQIVAGLKVTEDDKLIVLFYNPLDFNTINNLEMITGKKIVVKVTTKEVISEILAKVFTGAEQIDLEAISTKGSEDLTERELEEIRISEKVDSEPLVKLVNLIIVDAYQANASDVHIEPEEKVTHVRFRKDGMLYLYKTFKSDLHKLIVSRIKILAGIDVSNRQIPHDGSFRFSSQYLTVDLRVSTIPTQNGEKVVMRLLGADKNLTYDLYNLDLSDQTIATIEKAIKMPNGIFLVTGPTGSGKTTTLYSILNELAQPEISVVTVEDPVEKSFNGITQVQLNEKAGLTFPSALKSILRQDPDVIMIGEMRDTEAAEIAIRAAITGHLVLSTIHTNDTLSTITRLIDMGVEPYMVSSSVKCIIAQRLVRRNCPNCSVETETKLSEKNLIQLDIDTHKQGVGCEVCEGTGYKGRKAVFEILLIDSTLEKMISENRSIEEMSEYVKKQGMRTMRDEIVDLILQGETTPEEGLKLLYSVD